MARGKKTIALWAVAAVALASFAAGAYFATHVDDVRIAARVSAKAATDTGRAMSNHPDTGQSIELTEKDAAAIKPAPVGEREFPTERTAVGSIDFNQDMTVQVFTPYQGRIANP